MKSTLPSSATHLFVFLYSLKVFLWKMCYLRRLDKEGNISRARHKLRARFNIFEDFDDDQIQIRWGSYSNAKMKISEIYLYL